MKTKISEIFQSIQGEGKYVGVRQVFVRFYGCNLHCTWCDTPKTIGDKPGHFEEYSINDLLARIKELSQGCHSVSLTGGEPLAQSGFLKEFLPRLKKCGVMTYLDTNGILFKELRQVIRVVDTIAMDLKLPSSTECRAFWKEHEAFLKIAATKDVFIKAVISLGTTKSDVERAARLVARVDPNIFFILQPNHFELKRGVLKKCLEFQADCAKYLTNVQLIPQIHKLLKLR